MYRAKSSNFEFFAYMALLLADMVLPIYMSNSFTGFLALLIIIISGYYAIYANHHYKMPKAMKMLNILVIMFTLYGLILITGGQDKYCIEVGTIFPSKKYLVDLLKSLLPIYPAFVLTKKGKLTERNIPFLFCFFFVFAVLSYFQFKDLRLESAQMTNEYATDATNGTGGYLILSLLPFLVLMKKPSYLRIALLIAIGGLVFFSIKRGVIMSYAFCLIFYLPRLLKDSSKWKRVFLFTFIGVVFVYAYQYLSNFVENNSYFSRRIDSMSEGDLEARAQIWGQLLTAFFNADFFQMFFGRGAWGTLDVSINLAHNDWLEVLTNQGVLGFILFAVFWFSFYKSWKNSKQNIVIYEIIGLLFIINLSKTFFSMSISDFSLYASFIMGYAFAEYSVLEQKQSVIPVIQSKKVLK